MRKFIIRLLRFFFKLGIIGRVVGFKYQGKGVSLNNFYTQKHWSERQELKNRYKEVFSTMLADARKQKLWLDKYHILLFFNSRHDVDNAVGMIKIFNDTLKGEIVKEDDRKYFKGLMIFYDETLPFNTFEFILIEHKDD